MQFILLGAPGTGKGTQGKQLSGFLNIPNISTGEILREAIENETKLGNQAKINMKKGELVPDGVMIEIIKQRLQEEDCRNGFILDGFPRTLSQAIALDDHLEKIDKNINYVIALRAEHKNIIKRLVNRRVCRLCRKDYNALTNSLPNNYKCVVCGGEIWKRHDDDKATIENRLKIYEKITLPLKGYYKQTGRLKIFDGNGSSEEVQGNIREFLTIDDCNQKCA